MNDKFKGLMQLNDSLRPGLSCMPGSNEQKKAELHKTFAFHLNFSQPHIFFTISPDTGSTFTIAMNVSTLDRSHTDFALTVPVPSRQQRKIIAGQNPFIAAQYAHNIFDIFIDVFLGWNRSLQAPRKEGGLFGYIHWFRGSIEAQKLNDLHLHLLAAIWGLPTTTAEFTDMMKSEAFKQRFVIA